VTLYSKTANTGKCEAQGKHLRNLDEERGFGKLYRSLPDQQRLPDDSSIRRPVYSATSICVINLLLAEWNSIPHRLSVRLASASFEPVSEKVTPSMVFLLSSNALFFEHEARVLGIGKSSAPKAFSPVCSLFGGFAKEGSVGAER